MKMLYYALLANVLICFTVNPVAGVAQGSAGKTLYLEAAQETAGKYASAVQAMLSERGAKVGRVNKAVSTAANLISPVNTGAFSLSVEGVTDQGSGLHSSLSSLFDAFAGYSMVNLELKAEDVLNICKEEGKEFFQVKVTRKFKYKKSHADNISVDEKPLYFWFSMENYKALMYAVSTGQCDHWPFIPVPHNVQGVTDCATNQITFTWEYPYNFCGEKPVFAIFQSIDNSPFEALSEITSNEFLLNSQRGDYVALKLKARVLEKESEFSNPLEIKASTAPSNLTAREIILRTLVEVSWDVQKDTEYNIYRRETGRRSAQKQKIAKTGTSPFFDAEYKEGKSYEYLVTPLCGDGVEAIAGSVEISTVPLVKIETSYPDLRKPYILIKWNKLNLDERYRYSLYRADQRRNRLRKIASDKSLNDTTYFDKSVALGHDVFYKVTLSADTSYVERDISLVTAERFSFKGVYFGFQFQPLRSRVKNEFLDINPYGRKGKNSYVSLAFTADYFFHDRIGLGSGLGISTYSREIISDTGYTYNLTYIDLPLLIKSPVIKPYNYKNKVVINPILTAGINLSFLASKRDDTNLKFRDISPFNISFFGSFGVNYFISRTLMMSFSRFYSHGLLDLGPVYDAKSDKEYSNSNTIARGFILAAQYKFK